MSNEQREKETTPLSSAETVSGTTTDLLCMIPGPIEMDESVLHAVSRKATSHLDPHFVQTFSQVLHRLRAVFNADQSVQPFVVAGSGTLGWDMVATNLVQPRDPVLVVSTGIFGDWFGECLETYDANVTYLKPPELGRVPSKEALIHALQSNPSFRVITLTHVDTSTSVLLPIDMYLQVIKQYAPKAFIVLDAVCSAGAEHIDFQTHPIDVLVTASQKALGAPAGLSIVLVSARALAACPRARGHYTSWTRWLPIMQAYGQGGPARYFATPPVSLVYALHAALHCIPPDFVQRHIEAQARVHAWLIKHRLQHLTAHPAHTLSAVYLPESVPLVPLLAALRTHGIVAAGGVYPGLTYLRLGHMGISVTQPHLQHIDKLLHALTLAFRSLGWPSDSSVP